jgi:cell division septal protein FtsQ
MIVRLITLALFVLPFVFFYYIKSLPDSSFPDFFKIKDVNIIGAKLLPIAELEKNLNDLKGQNALRIDKQKLMSEILSYRIVDQVNIDFDYKGKFNVHLQEYQPFAIWHNKGNDFLINAKGTKLLQLKRTDGFENLLLIFGDGLSGQTKVVAELINHNSFLKENVISMNFIAGRRWDFYLKNDVLLKLPAENISEVVEICEKILTNRKYRGNIAILDLRLYPKKIFLTKHDKRKKHIRHS